MNIGDTKVQSMCGTYPQVYTVGVLQVVYSFNLISFYEYFWPDFQQTWSKGLFLEVFYIW